MSPLEMIGAGFIIYITLGMLTYFGANKQIKELLESSYEDDDFDDEVLPAVEFFAIVVAWPLVLIALGGEDDDE